jgi:hypothetical protein
LTSNLNSSWGSWEINWPSSLISTEICHAGSLCVFYVIDWPYIRYMNIKAILQSLLIYFHFSLKINRLILKITLKTQLYQHQLKFDIFANMFQICNIYVKYQIIIFISSKLYNSLISSIGKIKSRSIFNKCKYSDDLKDYIVIKN